MALRHLFQLISFLEEASDLMSLDKDAVAQAGPQAHKFVRYHRLIVAVSVLFGLIGFAKGVGLILLGAKLKVANKEMHKMLLAPLVFAVGGVIFGFAVTTLFAPRDFLAGPVGRKWMRLVGTESIFAARIVAPLVTMFFSSFLVFFAWAAWSDMYGRPF